MRTTVRNSVVLLATLVLAAWFDGRRCIAECDRHSGRLTV
jgi:hypothetical protein